VVQIPDAEPNPVALAVNRPGAARVIETVPVRTALAESVIGLFKTEVIRRRGPWRGLEDVEFATLEWVSWYNTQRLLEPIGYVPPVEYEAHYYRNQPTPAMGAGVN